MKKHVVKIRKEWCTVCENDTNHEVYVLWQPNKKKYSSKEHMICLWCDNFKK